jgi:hypothetical protein
MNGDDSGAERLIERGSDLAGALAGGALSLVGGPAGALGGAAVSVVIKHAAQNVLGRVHGRQEARAGAALLVVASDARERADRGEAPRADGFFDARGALRPEAEELLEAVLLQAANAYEERKVPLFAHLYDAVAHDCAFSGSDAHAFLHIATDLTYRQLVGLSVLGQCERYGDELVRADLAREESGTAISAALAFEIDRLGDVGLVGVSVDGKGPFQAGHVYGSQGPPSRWPPAALRLMPAGEQLFAAMRLTSIAKEDQAGWLVGLIGA